MMFGVGNVRDHHGIDDDDTDRFHFCSFGKIRGHLCMKDWNANWYRCASLAQMSTNEEDAPCPASRLESSATWPSSFPNPLPHE